MNAIIRYMKRNYKILMIVAVLAVALWSFIPKQQQANDPEKDKVLQDMVRWLDGRFSSAKPVHNH